MAAKKYFKGKQVLITGGLGFIGSNLAIKLGELGAKVTILDALLPNFGGNKFNISPIRNKVNLKIADMRSQKVMDRIVVDKEFIFNLAGTLSHVDSMSDPFLDLDINCKAQLVLLEACRKNNGATKIIFAGTRNQYGRALYLPVDEKHIQEPTDINGINSIAAEKYHFLYLKVYGIKTTSIRMSNTFGPRHQMRHPRQGVLNWFLRQLLEGKTVKLYGDGSQIRDMNYVDEVVEALLLLALSKNAWGEAYNLGGHPITLLDFVQKSIDVLGVGKYEVVKFPKERLSIEIGNYIADFKKIRDDVGWQPTVSLEDGIAKTFEYYRKYQKHYF